MAADYTWHYDLWRAIAEKFAGERMPGLAGKGFEKHIEKLSHMQRIRGTLVAYQPYKRAPNPPVLQFRLDYVTDTEGHPGEPAIHYEWVLSPGRHGGPTYIDAALHFHFPEPEQNKELLDKVPRPRPDFNNRDIPGCRDYVFKESRFYRAGWTCIRYRLQCAASQALWDPGTIADLAAKAMARMVEETWPSLIKHWPRDCGEEISADEVWARIVAHEHETFYTAYRNHVSYEAMGQVLRLSDWKHQISRTAIERALPHMPGARPTQLRELGIHRPSEVYAILRDKRIWGTALRVKTE